MPEDEMERLKKNTMDTVIDELTSLIEDKEVQDDIWRAMSQAYIDHEQGSGGVKNFKFPVPFKVILGRHGRDVKVGSECTITKKKKHSSNGAVASIEAQSPLED